MFRLNNMKLIITLLLAVGLSAQTQTTVNGRKAYSGAVNAQTGTYQAQVSDFNAPCGTIPVASGTFTITLVASTSQPLAGQCTDIINYGSGVITVARSGQNINGGTASLTIAAATASTPTGLHIVSDGANYEAQTWGAGGASPAGSYSEYQYRSSSSAFGAISNTGPLPTTSWTWVNQAAVAPAAINDFSPSHFTLSLPNTAATQLKMYCQPLSAAPYSAVITISLSTQGTGGEIGGLYLYDGTKLYGEEDLVNGLGTGGGQIRTAQWTNVTTNNSVANTTTLPLRTLTLKVADNTTNRIWYYWSGGAFVQLLSEATNTFLTPNKVCVGGETNDGGGTGFPVLQIDLTYFCNSSTATCNGN